MVRLARADLAFHADCWAILNLNVQRDYELRAQDQGLAALLGPYNRSGTAAWLPPESPVDDADSGSAVCDDHDDAAGTRDADLPPVTEAVAS